MSIFNIIRRIIPLQFMAVPWINSLQIIIAALHALSWVFSIIVTQRLFDTIFRASMQQAVFNDVYTVLLWMILVIVVQQLLNGLYSYMIVVMSTKSVGVLSLYLFNKLKKVEPVKFEDTAFLDNLEKAKEALWIIPFFYMTFADLGVFYIVYFISISAYLFFLSPILLFTLMLSFVPALLSQWVSAKIFTRLEEESAPLRRECDYYKSAICDRKYFKETRILGAYYFFHRLFNETLTLVTGAIWNAERKAAIFKLSLNLTSFLGMGLSTLLLFNATMSGTITIGAFAAVFAALSMIFGTMDEIINENLGQRSKDIGKVANFIYMMDMPEKKLEKTEESASGKPDQFKIIAKNISFSYPGSNNAVIKNVSLTINQDETVAIVGENGAGKSTLVKLLVGMYKPSEGAIITIDDSKISGVFQKYQRYKMTLKENIIISDLKSSISEKRLNQVLDEANVTTGTKEDEEIMNVEIMLSPEFGGIDLSGGQWQSIAIARGLYRDSSFMVLDEPTAAIDPLEETKVYLKFKELVKDKCTIIVTHRLGSAKLADKIVVMDSGSIVEIGTHKGLLNNNAKYAEMWNAQSKWYTSQSAPLSCCMCLLLLCSLFP